MRGIGGNITGVIQTRTVTKNEIGEGVPSWKDAQTLRGWLDLSSGDSGYTAYSAKVQESTHGHPGGKQQNGDRRESL